jgi:lipopolysaccharide export system permease protein
LFKDHYEMLNLKQLKASMDTLTGKLQERMDDYQQGITRRLQIYADTNVHHLDSLTVDLDSTNVLAGLQKNEKLGIYSTAINIARSSKTYSQSMQAEKEVRQKRVYLHEIEWHKKFTLSAACIVLFFIGAPLGALIRKGGLGMPVMFSIIIFIIYHIISITGMKLVKQGELPAPMGMWLATAILTPIGALLTYKSTTDSMLLDSKFYNLLRERVIIILSPITNILKKLKRKR